MTEGQEHQGRAHPPRERMVRSAGQLIRRKGVAATGMREVVVEADAPRGSLQHYFPEGKDELVSEALRWMGGVAARRVRRNLERLDSPSPGALLAAMVDDWKADLSTESYVAGCPLVAAAADSAASNEELRQVVRRAFDGWQETLREALVELGIPRQRAEGSASLVLSALEGAIIMARVRRDLAPLDAMVAELGPLLDASVEAARRRRASSRRGSGASRRQRSHVVPQSGELPPA